MPKRVSHANLPFVDMSQYQEMVIWGVDSKSSNILKEREREKNILKEKRRTNETRNQKEVGRES
jgi:hypothetical protein